MVDKKKDYELIYQLEGRPSLRVAFPLGLQHVLAMFIGNLAPVLVIANVISNSTGTPIMTPEQRAFMVQCCMFASGISTLIHLYPIKIGKIQIGAGLPIVVGTSFAFVPTMSQLGAEFGIGAIIGAVIAGCVVEVIMGIFLKPLKRLFPSLIIGAVLITIGLHLLPVGVTYFAGGSAAQTNHIIQTNLLAQGNEVPADVAAMASQYASWQNLLIGTTVLLVILILQRFAKGMFKVSAILIGIIVGYILAIILGQVDFTQVAEAKYISVPVPFTIKPVFKIEAIIAMAAIYIVSGLETIGNINGITVAAFDREATAKEISGGVLADAADSLVAAFFNTLPNTAFGQNAGIVAMTKVVNKFCILTGAAVLVIAGLCPKIGAVFSVMPSSILGGAVVTVFAMIMLNGMKLCAKAGFTERNMLILAITFGVGYAIGENQTLVANLPLVLHYIFRDSIVSVCIVSVLLNVIFPAPAQEETHE